MDAQSKDLDEFKVETCREDEVDDLLRFFSAMRSQGSSFLPETRSEILNKYRKQDSASGLLNLFLLKNTKNSIIGCSGYVPFKGMLRGHRLDGFMGSDAIIDPMARSRFPMLAMSLAKSYEKMVRHEKSFPLLYPASKEVAQAFKRVLWEEFTHVYKFVSGRAAQIPFDRQEPSLKFEKLERFDRKFSAFFKRVSSQHHFILNCDIDTLNWKYFKNPYANYVVLAALKNNVVLGYIVAEKRFDDIHILDITVDLKRPKIAVFLFFNVLKHFTIGKIDPVVIYLSHNKYMQIFTRLDFFNQWQMECLFFKVGLLFSSIQQDDFCASDKTRFHLNGFTPYLY